MWKLVFSIQPANHADDQLFSNDELFNHDVSSHHKNARAAEHVESAIFYLFVFLIFYISISV